MFVTPHYTHATKNGLEEATTDDRRPTTAYGLTATADDRRRTTDDRLRLYGNG
ncbi:MAG TPA: hypothetical protein VF707_04600 [Ardenticatenaceae bacterium]